MIPPVRALRKIEGLSAVFLPYGPSGRPDFAEFSQHLARTARAGLTPAVNMDTGFGPQLSPAERHEILKLTREALGPRPAFVAGAMPFGDPGDPLAAYRTSVRHILSAGGTPIVFPSELLRRADGAEVARLHREIIGDVPRALVFELGEMFAPFGRIYDMDTIKRLIEIPNLAGLKHSSLSRQAEFDRLALRDRERPEFRIYTGNDLGIDMVMYGSDYLLGLSAFDPKAFARRDAWWEAGDPRFFDLNDALQAVGAVAFRDPVPAYKDSAAVYLKLAGKMRDPRPHPACPRRPAWEADLLAPLAARVAAAMAAKPGTGS
jgi:dihydrodipicolinate synthase/N-acetylneuraminate lyase